MAQTKNQTMVLKVTISILAQYLGKKAINKDQLLIDLVYSSILILRYLFLKPKYSDINVIFSIHGCIMIYRIGI